LRVRVPAPLQSPATVAHLKAILAEHPGDAPVLVHLGERQVVRLLDRWNVDTTNGLLGRLREVLGPEAIVT
jgi:DNA polymerase III subunit alpha